MFITIKRKENVKERYDNSGYVILRFSCVYVFSINVQIHLNKTVKVNQNNRLNLVVNVT